MHSESFSIYDTIIIGGGAAGLFCAIEAGRRGRHVLVLEHNEQLGRKILLSGGGRCNFTNLQSSQDHYISSNPRFCISALNRYTPQDFIQLLERYHIRFFEKKLGQLFCQDSAKQILEMLKDELAQAKVKIQTNCTIRSVEKRDRFRITSSLGTYESETLVVATGGLSIPKLGASDLGYRIAKQFGIKIKETRPALVPLTLHPEDAHWTELRGISLDVSVHCRKAVFRENLLFSHQGLSGPAILQISSYWKPGDSITLNLLPENSAEELLSDRRTKRCLLSSWVAPYWPQRFARTWIQLHHDNRPINQISDKKVGTIAESIHQWKVRIKGTTGYDKAEVTLGGVDTHHLSSKTMECRSVPGLFFIGEVVDVTGQLGGYNFQWAWSSGWSAGQVV